MKTSILKNHISEMLILLLMVGITIPIQAKTLLKPHYLPYPPPDTTCMLTLYSNAPICESDTLFLFASVPDYDSTITFLWQGPQFFTSTNQSPILPGISTAQSGYYVCTAYINANCTKKDSLYITVLEKENCSNSANLLDIKTYSGFTPNNDGINDKWIINNIESYLNNKVTIFDRWGVPVWQANGYNNKDVVWKGDNNVSNKPLTDGTYFYVIKINDKTFKGWVELTR